MSWNAFASVFKSTWMKTQGVSTVILLLILWMGHTYFFDIQPTERREDREAMKHLRADIQEGHQRIEALHTKQLDRAFEVLETLLPPGVKRDRDTAAVEIFP